MISIRLCLEIIGFEHEPVQLFIILLLKRMGCLEKGQLEADLLKAGFTTTQSEPLCNWILANNTENNLLNLLAPQESDHELQQKLQKWLEASLTRIVNQQVDTAKKVIDELLPTWDSENLKDYIETEIQAQSKIIYLTSNKNRTDLLRSESFKKITFANRMNQFVELLMTDTFGVDLNQVIQQHLTAAKAHTIFNTGQNKVLIIADVKNIFTKYHKILTAKLAQLQKENPQLVYTILYKNDQDAPSVFDHIKCKVQPAMPIKPGFVFQEMKDLSRSIFNRKGAQNGLMALMEGENVQDLLQQAKEELTAKQVAAEKKTAEEYKKICPSRRF
jgi:uncharacterized lipoprotein YajG